MSKRDSLRLIEDMLESSNKILRYSNDLSFEDFLEDEKAKDAVIINFGQ